ncbi:MAG: hypothetical protein J7K87_00500 [Candidatus Aenigmarchaeota archaeon]|nr:hypothetical protein [Candidatus Aenigmarchaeota archaeon]
MKEITENDIKNLLKKKNVLFGFRQAKKALKNNILENVIVSSDSIHEKEFENKYKLIFKGDSKKMGIICGKPFSISVIAILKE